MRGRYSGLVRVKEILEKYEYETEWEEGGVDHSKEDWKALVKIKTNERDRELRE